MKVALLIPPNLLESPLPTLGIAALSAYVKQHGHECLIVDLWADPLDNHTLQEKIASFSPDLIGVTFYTIRYANTNKLIQQLKRWFPLIPIIVGGPHASALPTEVLEEIKAVDYVAIGEGEQTLLETLEALPTKNLKHVHGLALRDGDRIITTPPRDFIHDLDTLPIPDLEQVHPAKYKMHPPYGWYGLPLIMVTTRGCPGRCIFCSKSVFKKRFRSMSPERIVQDIQYWRERMPIKEVRFFDDDFTISKQRTFDICDLMVKEKINLPWTCTTRVDFLTREMLMSMKQSGLYFIALGVESGSPRILDALGKGYTVEHIRKAFQWCHELNLTTFAFFMVGNPGETAEDIAMTEQLQREIKPNFLTWSILRIMPGSPLFDQCRGNPNYTLTPENQYFDVFRKDIDYNHYLKIQKKNMFRHYTSWNGIQSIIVYLVKTRNFKAIRDYIEISRDKRNPELASSKQTSNK